VFVLFPAASDRACADDAQRGAHAPRFFVLSQKEVYEAWRKESRVYNKPMAELGQEIATFAGMGKDWEVQA